eukprot:sb/3477612/
MISKTGRYLEARTSLQSDPDLPGPDIPEPRLTGRINFPRYRKLTVFHPDIPGTPIYREKSFSEDPAKSGSDCTLNITIFRFTGPRYTGQKPFPPTIPVNRGPTVQYV